jgi:hypothetical protein
MRHSFGALARDIACPGLAIRHDQGRQTMSDVFQGELVFLDMKNSSAFVRAP